MRFTWWAGLLQTLSQVSEPGVIPLRTGACLETVLQVSSITWKNDAPQMEGDERNIKKTLNIKLRR